MKRTIAALVILALCLGIGLWSCLSISNILGELDHILIEATGAASEGQLSDATHAVQRFDNLFRDNERLFEVFIKRELLYNLQSDSGTLKAYAVEENVQDFLAEAFKARRHLTIIRDSLFGPL